MVNGAYEADQAQESKKELAGNQRHESPGSDAPLSSGRHRARMANWVDEKAGCPRHQSRIFEVHGREVSELAANPKSVVSPPYEMYVSQTKPLPSLPLQRRSSPELHHPVHSEPERDSLWQKLQKRRETPASHPRGFSADSRRSDWTVVGATEIAASSTSWQHINPNGSLHSIPTDGDEILDRNTYTLQGGASVFYEPRFHPRSHVVSPEDPAPTMNYPLTNAVFPSSPNAALASLPSDMLSPVSPIVEYLPPTLTIASPITTSHHGSSAGASEHREENTGGQTSDSSSPAQSILKEPNDTVLLFAFPDSNNQSLLPVYHSMESSVPKAPQTANSISRLSLPTVQNRYELDDLDIPSVRTQPDSQGAIDIALSHESTLPSTGFHMPPFSGFLNCQKDIVTGLMMEMGDFDNSDMRSQNLEQSDAVQSFCFPDAQPWSPLDHLLDTNAIDLHSTGPQWYSNDYCPQAASRHQSHDSGISQALFVKWRNYCFDHNAFLMSQLAPKLQQVEELQDLIRAINYLWMQRMESQPGLWSLCSTLSPSNLFDRAIRTLKNFIRGIPPEGFESVFALMHLAFAAAFSLTWQQDDYSFSALRDDAVQWQHALPCDEDKTRFLNAMNCWRLNFRSMTPQESLYCGDQQTLRNRLKKGEIFKAFIALVDSELIRS